MQRRAPETCATLSRRSTARRASLDSLPRCTSRKGCVAPWNRCGLKSVAARREIGRAIVALSAAVIVGVTLRPVRGPSVHHFGCVFCGELGGVDFILNALLFVPLGVG